MHHRFEDRRALLALALALALAGPRAWAQAKPTGAPPQAQAPAQSRPAPARPPAEAKAGSAAAVAVLPLRALGAPTESARALEKTLRNEVAAVPEARLVDPAAVAAALQREPDCLAQISCAAAAAASAGAQQLIVGTVSRLGDAFTLDLKLVDARTAQELRRATHPMSGKEDALIELLRGTAVELLAPARYVGALSVALDSGASDEARGAELFIDGQPRGTLPLDRPIEGLTPGTHTVRVAKKGFRDATLFVEVRFDRTTQARIDLARGALAEVEFVREPAQAAAAPAAVRAEETGRTRPAPPLLFQGAPPPPREPWLKIAGWSGVGLGAVALIAGIAVHAKAYAVASDLNRRSRTNQLSLADLASYDQINSEMRAARILYVVGGVVAAGGAGALLYDRHLDERNLRVGAAPLPAGGEVGVSGRF